jgi:tetrahydromethanopterin S-methyltransferase subunit G
MTPLLEALLRKVQAVGETSHGGQVGSSCPAAPCKTVRLTFSFLPPALALALNFLQIMMEQNIFQGIHACLPELGLRRATVTELPASCIELHTELPADHDGPGYLPRHLCAPARAWSTSRRATVTELPASCIANFTLNFLQIMMDSDTFRGIHARLPELGLRRATVTELPASCIELHTNFLQIMMDSDTFRGIHARLPELGGAVLEATQKLLLSLH